jgi:hypothetical protein
MFNPIWKFDFKVVIDEHVVILPVGKSIAVPVRLELVRGDPQQINLDFTNWESVGLIASIHFSEMPPGKPWKADLLIRASASTPPGSYLFTVRGSAKGTFHTSQDAVTVIVKPKDKRKADNKNNLQSQQPQQMANAANPPSPSFDLDKLFMPKDGFTPEAGAGTPSMKPMKKMRVPGAKNLSSALAGMAVIGGIILGAILIGSALQDGGGGGGFGVTRNCIGSFLGNAPECSDCNPVYENTTFNGRNVGSCIAHPGTGRYEDQCDITCK